jgi:arylsulfatase A-like enzyme/predicted Zn-dependent protease
MRTVPLAVAALTVAAAVAGGWLWWRSMSSSSGGPLILISIDTLRADRLPLYGYKGTRTPNIDAFAKDAAVFERAYSHSPQTLPAHTSMLTGRLPFEHGVRDNIGFSVKSTETLLQQLLKERGFSTGGFVSAYVMRKATGIGRGFDVFDDDLPPASSEASVAQVQRDGMATFAAARRWLESLSTDRFFLFFHIYEPHTPYRPPARYAAYSRPYDGEIAYADEIVGALLQLLRERGVYDRATIVLVSDHGEGLGDHGELEHGVFLYDESIRVPLVVKLPHRQASGSRVRTVVQLIDLLPTILQLTGTSSPGGLRGRSLAPLLNGHLNQPGGASVYSEALYSRYHFGWSELYALTDGRFRYIKAPRAELFDLEADPGERQNLADSRSQTRDGMNAALTKMIAAAPKDQPAAITDEQRQQFQALGYVATQVELAADVDSETLPDPKDKIGVLEQYRRAIELAGNRSFDEAIEILRRIVADNPQMADVWSQLGALLLRADRPAEATEAYKRFVALKPREPAGLIGAAGALLKAGRLGEARQNAELALTIASADDSRALANARYLLVRIALAAHDPVEARRQAALAKAADPDLPLPDYVQGVILYEQGQVAAAIPFFERALQSDERRMLQMPDLRYHLGDSYARLERYRDAERLFRDELRLFPQDHRARAGLAMVYRATGRNGDAERAIEDMLAAVPTPEAYDLAARLWNIFGEPQRAERIRREAAARFHDRGKK